MKTCTNNSVNPSAGESHALRDMLAVFHWTGSHFVVEVFGHEIARMAALKDVRALVEQHNGRLSESIL